MSLGLIMKKNLPPGCEPSDSVTREYMKDLVDEGLGLPTEIMSTAASVNKHLEKECKHAIAAIAMDDLDREHKVFKIKTQEAQKGRVLEDVRAGVWA